MSFEDVIPLDVQRLDRELENMTDRGSSERSDQELEALPDLETVRSKVGRVVWVYPVQSVSLRSVDGIPPASPNSKMSTLTQRTAPSLRIPLQERNQGWKHAEEGKPYAGEVHREGMIRARDTVWEGRLRGRCDAWNHSGTSRSFVASPSIPPGGRKSRMLGPTRSSARRKEDCAGRGPRRTTAAMGDDVDLQINRRRGNVIRQRVTTPAFHPTKTRQRGELLGVVKSRRSRRKA